MAGFFILIPSCDFYNLYEYPKTEVVKCINYYFVYSLLFHVRDQFLFCRRLCFRYDRRYSLFTDPIMVSSKDIHLDSGHLIGQDVVFQGESSLRVISKLILFLTMTLEG